MGNGTLDSYTFFYLKINRLKIKNSTYRERNLKPVSLYKKNGEGGVRSYKINIQRRQIRPPHITPTFIRNWLVVGSFSSLQHLRSYQDGALLETIMTFS